MSKHRHNPHIWANPDRARADAERRRSNAAGPHLLRTTRRKRTRTGARTAAIRDFA